MKLYFENSVGDRRLIATPQNREEAFEAIRLFCEERSYRIYYIRTWREPDGGEVFDVGSHTEFFYCYEDDENRDC